MGDLFNFINGKAFKSEDWDTCGLPIIRIQNLTSDREYNYYNGYIEDKYKIHHNDIIFSWSGTIDTFVWTGGDAVLNQHLFKVIAKNIDKTFGLYLLQSCMEGLQELSHGAVMKHLKKGDVDNFQVQIPTSISEQQSIANLFQTYDSLADSIQKSIDTLEKEKNSIMQKIFA